MPLSHEKRQPRLNIYFVYFLGKTLRSRGSFFVLYFVFGRRVTAFYTTSLDSCFKCGEQPISLRTMFFVSCIPGHHAVDARVTHHGRILDVSWKFYGFTRGEACVLGMETFASTRMFGAFWLHGGKIVGAFLEVSEASVVFAFFCMRARSAHLAAPPHRERGVELKNKSVFV